MEIEIKKATLENLDDIINFNQQLFDYEYEKFDKTLNCEWPSKNRDYYKSSIEDDNALTLVAVIKGKFVGYLIGWIGNVKDYRNISKLAELDNMFILPEARGKGVGSKLCQKFFEWVKEKGVKRLKVIASAKNEKAINCYRRNGFEDYNLTLEKDLN